MNDRASRLVNITLAIAASLLAVSPVATHAQSFGFSVSSGGHHHHHHGGGWSFGYGYNPWWGPAYYAPPPAIIYAAPPPPQVVREIYVQPQSPPPLQPSPYSSNASPAPPAPIAANSTPSLPVSNSSDDRIVIRNSAGAQLPVSFLVDGQDAELAEGATRTFVGKTHRTVQYDRGGRFGTTQQDLTGGQYEFRITATGWDLVKKPQFTPSSRTAIRSNSLPDTSTSR